MINARKLTDRFTAAPQIEPQDCAGLAAMGFGIIVNNRPDGEEPDQPSGAEIEAAALAAGMGYCAIPVDQSGFSAEQVAALAACLVSPKPVFGYCRSGTRSTRLWALAEAARGTEPAVIIAAAAAAGFDVRPLGPAMEQLRKRS
ncbi:MAG: TIGR01244 family phosphatase [Sandarakinorhabdus sp.]|nr:TIGR01244 family phosphatase [Sandarakinorhabdus sp.]MBS3962797.1 TIGR01244 family phosphatase [Sandarakinorhabdus sp.]